MKTMRRPSSFAAVMEAVIHKLYAENKKEGNIRFGY